MIKSAKNIIIFLVLALIIITTLVIAVYIKENRYTISNVSSIKIGNNGKIKIEETITVNINNRIEGEIVIPITLGKDDSTSYNITLDENTTIPKGYLMKESDDLYYYTGQNIIFISNAQLEVIQ